MCIITGPRIELATDLIGRIKKLFYDKLKVTFESKESQVTINGVRITAYPSHHISSVRGIPNVSFLFVDEAGFIPSGSSQTQEVIDTCERYAGKSQAYIVLLSTPNRPGDIMDAILQQPYPESFYKICKFNYQWGLGKIYTEEDILVAKASSSFEREYNNAFLGQQGDVFAPKDIEAAIVLGNEMGYEVNLNCRRTMGIDPAFGGSNYAIVVLQYQDGRIQVTHAEQHHRPNYNAMIDRVMEIYRQCGNSINNIFVDAANPSVIDSLKQEFREDTNWNRIKDKIAHYKKMNMNIAEAMKVVPTPFSLEGIRMLVHTKEMLETPNLIAINSKFNDLTISLRTAKADNYRLIKTDTVFSDVLDAFRLALQYFQLTKK